MKNLGSTDTATDLPRACRQAPSAPSQAERAQRKPAPADGSELPVRHHHRPVESGALRRCCATTYSLKAGPPDFGCCFLTPGISFEFFSRTPCLLSRLLEADPHRKGGGSRDRPRSRWPASVHHAASAICTELVAPCLSIALSANPTPRSGGPPGQPAQADNHPRVITPGHRAGGAAAGRPSQTTGWRRGGRAGPLGRRSPMSAPANSGQRAGGQHRPTRTCRPGGR